jgi:dTDP-glucose 4,6-dehydratase
MKYKKFLITGGLGFIGGNFLKILTNKYPKSKFLNIDKFTYAASKDLAKELRREKNYNFHKVDICDFNKLRKKFEDFNPDIVIHFAAESHVDNSIKKPYDFINTNIIGTYNLLKLLKKKTKIIHISTDEVFGEANKNSFTESSKYDPRSPYSATKASSDHLVRAWSNTYGINYNIINSSNNFGPYQNKEKFIPVVINSIINQKKIPLYGNGENIREWIYVDDFINAIEFLIKKAIPNQTFLIGSGYAEKNIDLINKIIKIIKKETEFKIEKNLIKYVKDRAGHDRVYKVNSNKIRKLGWKHKIQLNDGLLKTIKHYINQSKELL